MNTYQPFFCVIMPLGPHTQVEEKREVVCEEAKPHGFTARFPEFQREACSFSLISTLQDFKQASFILVDLSFERPSCYYELGLAEALGTKVHLLALKGSSIHQTSNREAVQFFEDLEQFRTLIGDILKEARNI